MTYRKKGLLSSFTTRSRLLNSVCLFKVSTTQIARYYSTQDLLKKDRYELFGVSTKFIDLQKLVEEKQIELVRLAEQHGINDKKVYDRQLILIRSLLFRQYVSRFILTVINYRSRYLYSTVDNISKKEEVFEELVQYLRDMIYHSNKYLTKSYKSPFSSIICNCAMYMLVNLVLYPLVEFTSDSNNYGYRLHRDCKQAIAALRAKLRSTNVNKAKVSESFYMLHNKDKYILEGHIQDFFDNVSHKWLLDNLPLHPEILSLVEIWLKTKVLKRDILMNPINGVFDGGILSPTI